MPGANAQLIVVDLTLEQGSGLDLLRAAATLCPHSRFVVYSVHEDGDKVRQAMQAGAMGYVTKREDPDVLLNALQEVGAGRRFLSPRAARAMADVVAHVPLPAPQEALSPQELQVFVLTGEGHTPQSIAERMGISVRTIETYYSRIVDKLALGGRKELRLSATNWVRKTL